MKTQAIVVDEVTDERKLQLKEIEIPAPGAGEVLIEVKAAGINPADILQRMGKYPPPYGASATLGLELSGVISELGSGVTGWEKGQEVFTLVAGGAYAHHALAPASMLWRKPAGWSFTRAAAIPEGVLAAFLNLVMEGELSVGERVLIQGGSGGVGTFAVQIARRLGAQVAATAGSDERCAKVKELGAHECINYKTSKLGEHEPFDLILDILGAPSLGLVKLLKTEGRLVFIGTQGGAVGELDIRELMRKRARIIGSVLRPRSVEEKSAIKNQFDFLLGEALFRGEIRPIVDSIVPLSEAGKAHARMKSGQHFGKIVLTT